MNDEPIPAATLVVVRDIEAGPPELLIVERAGAMAFAAGALVFPGGRIDEADNKFATSLGLDGAMVAAIRETVEETAVPVGLAPVPDARSAMALQDALVADRPFDELLEEHGLKLDPDALTPFARWVPKFHAVRRFDTMFYVAKAPDGDWQPRVIEGECAAARWLAAAEVLALEESGEARLIFPTRRTLERLALHADFDAIRADALAFPVEPVTPWLEERDGEQFITIPADLGYPVTSERLEGQWRG